jgi:alkanesulfonate monooxygenase SsuD/methylene tetrahydromethanopterin reductase-like flavin-dependent oxidoreductase (luciferase family)
MPKKDLGMIFTIRQTPARPRSLYDIYNDYLDDAEIAERELGFEYLWVSEHHLCSDRWCPAPFAMLGAVAARTKKIRLGTAVLVPALHNPLEVSENFAMLDNLSGGRMDIGVGAGASPEEFIAFNVPPNESWRRTWEVLDFIGKTFTQERVTFNGEFFKYDDVWQSTKPIQNPVPVWWGGFGPNSLRRAAERGYHIMGAGAPAYDEALIELGKPLDDHKVAQITAIHLAETHDQAWDEAQEGIHWFVNFHRIRNKAYNFGCTPEGPLEKWPPAEELRNIKGLSFMPRFPMYVGTPEFVREELIAYLAGRNGRITQLLFDFRAGGGPETPAIRRSMELFRTEVMPYLPLD